MLAITTIWWNLSWGHLFVQKWIRRSTNELLRRLLTSNWVSGNSLELETCKGLANPSAKPKGYCWKLSDCSDCSCLFDLRAKELLHRVLLSSFFFFSTNFGSFSCEDIYRTWGTKLQKATSCPIEPWQVTRQPLGISVFRTHGPLGPIHFPPHPRLQLHPGQVKRISSSWEIKASQGGTTKWEQKTDEANKCMDCSFPPIFFRDGNGNFAIWVCVFPFCFAEESFRDGRKTKKNTSTGLEDVFP